MNQAAEYEDLTSEEIGEFLKYMRKSINYTQTRFAEELGVRPASIGHWEKGRYMPKNRGKIINSVRVLVKQKIREGA